VDASGIQNPTETTTVSAKKANPSGEARQTPRQADPTVGHRWPWAEPAVWTPRMLTALEQGVKGGKWYSLMDKVWPLANLEASLTRVARNRGAPGVDHVTIAQFSERRSVELPRLQQALQEGTYRPQAIRRTHIDKPGSKEQRPLGIPTVRDRTAQGALRQVLEPIFERDFAEHSYGFRPGRGCKDALRRVTALLKAGRYWVVDADIKGYFDSIPHDRLMALIEAKICDSRVLALIRMFLQQEVLEDLARWTPEQGTPQGAVLSPLLANIYLDPLDHLLADQGFDMVRYADDFLILCRTRAEAEQALALVRTWVEQAGLQLHPTKTRLVNTAEPGGAGFEFLGYRFATSRGHRLFCCPRDKSMKKMRASLRELTCRHHGQSLPEIIQRLNPTLRGWFNYFKHGHVSAMVEMDGYVRRRLRAILECRRRQRAGRRGRLGLGLAHQRWPNSFFREHGLFSLEQAHAALRQSSRR
jgi:RNA-directed DNA polymerase